MMLLANIPRQFTIWGHFLHAFLYGTQLLMCPLFRFGHDVALAMLQLSFGYVTLS